MQKNINTQIAILGGGPSGYSAAFRCADLGFKTVLIEKFPQIGGVCLHVGCIPSKALLHIAKIIQEIIYLNKFNILNQLYIKNILDIQNWKNNLINQISDNLKKLAFHRNIKIINGLGMFKNQKTITVKNNKKRILYNVHYENSIIATGSRPSSNIFIKIQDKKIWNSTDALSLPFIPKKFLIVGGGVIGLEIATVYSAFGSIVDIVEISDRLIPSADKDISKIFTNIIMKQFNLMLNTTINKIDCKNNIIDVTLKHKNNFLHNFSYDAILIATGRIPNIEHLNINKIGIKLNKKKFVLVNKYMNTNISNIYAIGDVIGEPMLAHKSVYDSYIASEVIAGKKVFCKKKYDIPYLIYTNPQVGWVGLTSKIAKKKNILFKTSTFPWNASGLSIVSGYTNGLTKLVFNAQTHKIIGGAVIGTNGGELLGEISLAIEMGCDVEDISSLVHAHPTLYETICGAAKLYHGSITELLNINQEIDFLK